MKTLKALYFIFVLLLLFAEPIGMSPLHQLLYDAFAIGNLINLVRILRKPSNLPGRVHQDAR